MSDPSIIGVESAAPASQRTLASVLARFQQFSRAVHAGLGLDRVAYSIANEGRWLIGCDRLSVAVDCGRGARTLAVSGQDLVNERANLVRKLNALADAVIAQGDPLWHSGEETELAPQIEQALNEYVDESHARSVAVVPLVAESEANHTTRHRPLGALVIEQFTAEPFDESFQNRTQLAAEQAALALGNAWRHQAVFLLPLWETIGKSRWLVQARTLPKTVSVLVALAALLIAAVVVPADLELDGRGKLQPLERRNVYARIDGVVDEVRVKHGQIVTAGEVLATLRSTAQKYQVDTVWGELQTVNRRLESARKSLPTTDRQSADGQARYTQLASEIEQLTAQAESLERRHKLLVDQEADLKVTSPISGQVVTWDVANSLLARPVERGQSLLTIADLEGPWVLEVLLPDRRAGEVLAAAKEQPGTPLDVSFILATDPATTYQGRLQEIASSSEVDEDEGNAVQVIVAVDRASLAAPRPGATVVAKINCGRHSIGYVWLYDLIQFVRSKVLFRL
jgi:multidrug efflux pump subunit AcrA (membrane-fusion protein)